MCFRSLTVEGFFSVEGSRRKFLLHKAFVRRDYSFRLLSGFTAGSISARRFSHTRRVVCFQSEVDGVEK